MVTELELEPEPDPESLRDKASDRRTLRALAVLLLVALCLLSLGLSGYLVHRADASSKQVAATRQQLQRLEGRLTAEHEVLATLQGASKNTDTLSTLTTTMADQGGRLSALESHEETLATRASLGALQKRFDPVCDQQIVTNQISAWNGAGAASGNSAFYSELANSLIAACQPYSGP